MDPLSVATPELSPPAEDKLQNASGKERVSDIVARDGEHVVDDERAASPAAPVSPPESAVKEAAVVSAEGTLSDPAPLPVLWLNAIPFKDVAGRMIQAANTKFQTLLTTLPNAPPLDRQQQLLQYAATQHAEFQKLLVLTRFLRKAQDWQQVMDNLPPKPPDQHATGLILAELEKLIRRRLELEIVPDAMRKHMVVGMPGSNLFL
ncbi:hypothetical protein HKX48_003823 [Thoreauomyces humboldtii]|nr:hypothetical protein HKX48_003823 [Thoreauomyces humboldtii]